MASFPFKEALFVGCKALWNKPVWEVCIWYRALLRRAFLLGLFTYAGIVIAMGFGDGEGEHDNLSRWIGSFVIAVLSRLLNKVFCCPDKKLRPWQKESRKKGRGGGMQGWLKGRRAGGEGERPREDRRGALVGEDKGGRERKRVWDVQRSLFPREAVPDWSRAGLHTLNGPNNSLSNGIVPLRIVCTQVRSLGVLAHQVSIGLNTTALKIRATYNRGCPTYLKDDVWVPSLFFHKTPWKGSRWQ